jgi:hypothetical protein
VILEKMEQLALKAIKVTLAQQDCKAPLERQVLKATKVKLAQEAKRERRATLVPQVAMVLFH